MGGPGSGKTTIALLKAKNLIEQGVIGKEQTVLFLSFARATISRVEEHANIVFAGSIKLNIEITTYHSFAWTILKSHGYLLNERKLRLLPPHEASSRFAIVSDKESEKTRLFEEEGMVHFDLFANLCASLLSKSQALTRIISTAYPYIILDEFQDTNTDEWAFIQELGKNSCLIALADPDQRIYDFRGADPARIRQFTEMYHPETFDFGNENNRSSGTDIVQFGNDLLSGANIGKTYTDVLIHKYEIRKQELQLAQLKSVLLNIRSQLISSGEKDWSIAVLVPTNSLMITISSYLDQMQCFTNGKKLPRISHNVAIETAGPCIAAVLIATLLDGGSQKTADAKKLVANLREHVLGWRGAKPPSQADIKLTDALAEYIESDRITGKTRLQLVTDCNMIAARCNEYAFSGDVVKDWIEVRDIIGSASSESLKHISEDLKYLRLLHKGSMLNSGLSQIWRRNHNYAGAIEAVQNALAQEHFSISTQTWSGINVMTIHKAKGKEFDVVVVYEGAFPGTRIVRDVAQLDKARLNLRVAVTRAKQLTIICTPENDPCCLL